MSRWMLIAGLALAIAASPAAAQDASVVTNLTRYGRMPRRDAQELARAVHARLIENARSGGNRYDPLRQVLGVAMFGGPGQNRAEYDERLRQVIEQLSRGLTAQNLDALFAQSEGAALRCTELFSIAITQCDALIAAASRQRMDLPYLPPDDGSALSAELIQAGVGASDARAIVDGLSRGLVSVPASLDRSPRGRALAQLSRACPGGLGDRESEVRAWHLGATSGLARCIGRVAGRQGRRAASMLETAFGLPSSAAVVFLRWAHGQPIQAAPRPPTRDELMAQATQHYRAGRFADAARAYEQAVIADPGFEPAQQGLAVSRLRAGDPAGAAQAYRAAARLAPRSAAIQVGLARALTQTGDREGAAAAYRMALTLEPRRADATRELAALQPPAPAGPSEAQLRSQARAQFAARRFAEAERAYRTLTGMAPADAGLHAGLGASLLAQSRAHEAITAYRRATELDPTNAGFFAALGSAYEAASDPAQARAAYEQALAIDPNQRTARARLARLAPPSAPAIAATTAQPAPRPPAGPPRPTLPATPTRDDIVRTLAPYEERLEGCAPTIDAAVTFRLRIQGADGQVAEVHMLGDLAGTEEASCMEAHLQGARFPRFTDEELEVSYPFRLRGPRAGEAQPEAPTDAPAEDVPAE